MAEIVGISRFWLHSLPGDWLRSVSGHRRAGPCARTLRGLRFGETFRASTLPCEDSILFLLVFFVSHAMEAQFASLTEGLLAPIDAAYEGLRLGMNVHVLS